jgi:hypothetical protein
MGEKSKHDVQGEYAQELRQNTNPLEIVQLGIEWLRVNGFKTTEAPDVVIAILGNIPEALKIAANLAREDANKLRDQE